MRKALIAAMGALVVGAAGLGAGYYLRGIPTDWYAVDVAKLGKGPENDLIRYGRELIVDTPRYIGEGLIVELIRVAPEEPQTPRLARRGLEPRQSRGRRIPALRLAGAILQAALRAQDMELCGVRLKRGAAHEHPERLDLTRHPNRHIAFGTGIHFCLGHQLARIEERCALKALFTRWPKLSLAVDASEIRWRRQPGLCAIRRLPVAAE